MERSTAQRVDFALVVMSPLDTVATRQRLQQEARDNVVFEAGLFFGALGRERVFLLQPRGTDLVRPSDLSGVTALDDDPHKLNLRSALGPACTDLRQAMVEAGRRST